MEFSFEYSPLWLLPGGFLVAALVWWLYLANRGPMDWAVWLRASLASLRWLVLLVLGFLLLQPFLTSWINKYEKPILAVYEDASESILPGDKSLLEQSFGANFEALAEKYDIRWMQFGEDVSDSTDKQDVNPLYTDFGAIKEHLANRFFNQNVGAVVIATDGIQNKGLDPRYTDDGHSAPYFMLALGDSTLKSDAGVLEVLNNKLVFLNNDFQVKVRVGADQLTDELAQVSILRDGKEVAKKEVLVRSNRWVQEVPFTLKADKPGLMRYQVKIERVGQETNLDNNTANFFIDVLDNRTKVSIIAAVPHPDAGALKRAVEQNEQYEVTSSISSSWAYPADGIDLAILHGFPANAQDQNIIKKLQSEKVPIWYVLSATSNLVMLSQQLKGFSMTGKRGRMDQVGGLMASGFNLFNAGSFDGIKRMPPLYVPFGDVALGFQHQALMHQRIGTVETDRPLWVYYENAGSKGALLLAEGLWKWRMANHRMEGDTKWFDELVSKTVQYLSVRQKRTRLQLRVPQRAAERTSIEISAELYNESFELTNEPEVTFNLKDEEGRDFDYTFKPDAKGYALSVGNLKAGDYKWQASASMNGEVFTESGSLIISEVKIEQAVTRANHRFLQQWAARERGTVYYNAATISQDLIALETAKPKVLSEKEWTEIIEWKWLLALLALLVSIEWFLRKYHGSY